MLTTLGWLSAAAVAGTVVVCLWLATCHWRQRFRRVGIGWLFVGCILASAVVIDAAPIRPAIVMRPLLRVGEWSISIFEASAVVIAAGLGGFLLRQTSGHRLARVCVLVAIACALLNPITEVLEGRLISDPTNYTFVSNDQPYRFNADSSRQLDRVTTAQELSEDLGALLLLGAVGLRARRDTLTAAAL